MIRQAISCDVCGTEKRQTNHWFVAYEQTGELRVSGWTSRHRLRADAKHLCGQICMHKLVDEFMAKSIASPAKVTAREGGAGAASAVNESGLAPGAEFESSARLLVPSPQIPARVESRPQLEIVAMPARQHADDVAPAPADPPRYSSRSWHAEAWQRERERESRVLQNHPESAARRRFGAHRKF